MAIRINYNEISARSRRSAETGRDRFGRAAEHVATGSRINTAVDDAAGLAVAQRLKNQARSLAVAGRNAQQAISLIQVTDGAYAETQRLYGRMRELAIQAASDTINATDRTNLQSEMSALSAEVTRIAASTQMAGVSLTTGSTFQIGPNATTSANQVSASVPTSSSSSSSSANSLNALFSVTAGSNTVDVGNQSGIAYDGSTDTATTFAAAINAAGGNITASITSDNTLRLESTAAVPTVFANDTGNVASTLFATNATSNAVTSATTLANLGVSAGGTMTITATESSGGGGHLPLPALASVAVTP